MLRILFDPKSIEKNINRQTSDLKRSNGIMGEFLQEGMQVVYNRVNNKLKNAFGNRI